MNETKSPALSAFDNALQEIKKFSQVEVPRRLEELTASRTAFRKNYLKTCRALSPQEDEA